MYVESNCPYCKKMNYREVTPSSMRVSSFDEYRLCECQHCSEHYGIKVKINAVVTAAFKLVAS